MTALPFAPRSIRLARQRAFTLVEVVLSLGVVSFGLISMLGLLTVGLKTFHDTVATTTETQITQEIANQLTLANYSALSQSAQSNYYFTQEGLPTSAASAVYFATVKAPAKLTVPGGSTAYPTNTLTFVILISSKAFPSQTNATPIQIANNGS